MCVCVIMCCCCLCLCVFNTSSLLEVVSLTSRFWLFLFLIKKYHLLQNVSEGAGLTRFRCDYWECFGFMSLLLCLIDEVNFERTAYFLTITNSKTVRLLIER